MKKITGIADAIYNDIHSNGVTNWAAEAAIHAFIFTAALVLGNVFCHMQV